MKIKKPKKKVITAMSMVLALLTVLASAFALLTTVDTKTNTFTVGHVKVKLIEEFDSDFDGETEIYDEEGSSPPIANNVIAGEEIIKRPFVENTGSNNAWVFMAVGIPVANPNIINNEIRGEEFNIEVKALAIQDHYADEDTYTATWNKYMTESKKKHIFGDITEQSYNVRFRLFETVRINNTDWVPIDAVYKTDTHDYYCYALKVPLAPNETTLPLFEAVILDKHVGGHIATANSSRDINEEMFKRDNIKYLGGFKPLLFTSSFLTALREKNMFNEEEVSFDITPYRGSRVGTGSILKLISNETNEVVDKYTIIIYGDIDGDGRTTANDSSVALRMLINTGIDYPMQQLLAANVIGNDLTIDYNDAKTISAIATGVFVLNQEERDMAMKLLQ